MKASVIIVNYNKKDLLRACLISLEKVTYNNFNIIIVDNGSDDGSIELVKKQFPHVIIIEMGHNSGFCKANNIGIHKSLELGADVVVLLNNDTEVTPDFLTEMIKKVDIENKVGMIAAKIIFFKDRSLIDSAGMIITPDGFAKNRGLCENSNLFSEDEEVFCPAGAAALFSRELLKDIEYDGQFLDEDYEFYYEELDMGWRARLRSWKCIYNHKVVVYHHKSVTAGPYSEFVAYYTNRNIVYNIIKNYPSLVYVLKAFVLSFFRYILYAAGFMIKKGVGNKIMSQIGLCKTFKVFIKSYKDAILNIPTMIKKRKAIQGKITINNEEIGRFFKELGLSFADSIFKL